MIKDIEKDRLKYADSGVSSIVLVGLFGAITYLGVQFFRIPLPAAVGTPFIHFGNSFVVLSVLFLGFYKGGLAGAIGLGIFDVLNGYAAEAPIIMLDVFIVAFVVMQTYRLFRFNDSKISTIITIAIAAGLTKIVLSFVEGLVKLLISGSGLDSAITSSVLSLPATVVNSISTVIIVTLLYAPIKKALDIFQAASKE